MAIFDAAAEAGPRDAIATVYHSLRGTGQGLFTVAGPGTDGGNGNGKDGGCGCGTGGSGAGLFLLWLIALAGIRRSTSRRKT